MATASLTQHLTLTINGVTIEVGDRVTPTSITFSETTGLKSFALGASGGGSDSKTIFDRGVAGELSVLDFLGFRVPTSGATVVLEFKSDGASPNYALFPLVAGRWYFWHDGAMYRDYGAIGGTAYTQFTSGTLAEIDTIAAKNNGAAAAAIEFLGLKT